MVLGVVSTLTAGAPAAHLAHVLHTDRQAVGVGLYRTALGLGSAAASPFVGWWIARGSSSTGLVASIALPLISTCAFAWIATDSVTPRRVA